MTRNHPRHNRLLDETTSDIRHHGNLPFVLNKDIVTFSEDGNRKLTDFGSCRNVNVLTTNMTFTKVVGTPICIAPRF